LKTNLTITTQAKYKERYCMINKLPNKYYFLKTFEKSGLIFLLTI